MWAGGRTDGRTDITKLIDALRNFAKTLKNQEEDFDMERNNVTEKAMLLEIIM
jgi:hypothetical protein